MLKHYIKLLITKTCFFYFVNKHFNSYKFHSYALKDVPDI